MSKKRPKNRAKKIEPIKFIWLSGLITKDFPSVRSSLYMQSQKRAKICDFVILKKGIINLSKNYQDKPGIFDELIRIYH